jgi:hypothetical protein
MREEVVMYVELAVILYMKDRICFLHLFDHACGSVIKSAKTINLTYRELEMSLFPTKV